MTKFTTYFVICATGNPSQIHKRLLCSEEVTDKLKFSVVESDTIFTHRAIVRAVTELLVTRIHADKDGISAE